MLNRFNQILIIIIVFSVIGTVVLWFLSRPPSIEFDPMLPADGNDPKSPILDDVISEAPVDVDIDDPTEVYKYLFTEDERAQPEFQQFMQVIESPQYTAFIESEPETLGDFFDFFASQGLPVDKNQMFNIFLELAPVGTPEQLEQRARVTLSIEFQQMPYNIRSRQGMQAFQQIIEEFLADEQNTAWMMTHFNGNFMAFGDWTIDVFRNPIRDIPDPTELVEIEIPKQPKSKQEPPDTENKTVLPQQPSGNEEVIQSVDIDDPKPHLEPKPLASFEQEFETLLRKEFDTQELTKEKLNTAMQYLIILGEEEGLKRLMVDDPKTAAQIERVIRQRQKGGIPR